MARLEERHTVALAQVAGAEVLDPALGPRWWDRRYDFYHPAPPTRSSRRSGARSTSSRPTTGSSAVYDALHTAVRLPYANTGLELRMHFSHWYLWGTMIYGRFVVPDGGPDALALHDRIWEDGMSAALDAGGVMNDHHGVGPRTRPLHAPPARRRAGHDGPHQIGARPPTGS